MILVRPIFGALCAGCFVIVSHLGAQERTWSDPTGKHQTIAELIDFDAKSVTLKKQNGVTIQVPLSRLSPDDVLFIQNLLKPAPIVEPALETIFEKQHLKELIIAEISAAQQMEIIQQDLKEPLAARNFTKVRMALNQLKSGWPKSPTGELIEELAVCFQAPNKFVRLIALELLASHDLLGSREFALAGTSDSSLDVRWLAYDCLGAIADDYSIEQLTKKLVGEDSGKVCSVLKKLGAPAEVHVSPLLKESHRETRLAACGLLAHIGTEESIPLLQEIVESDPETVVQSQAKNALRGIESRRRLTKAQ